MVSPMCFLRQCALTMCAPNCECSIAAKNWHGLEPCSLCAESWFTVVNHYCTQDWGLTMAPKLGSHKFCAAMMHSQLCPTLWPLCHKTARSWPCTVQKFWTVVNHCCSRKSLLHTKLGSNHVFLCGKAALTVCVPHCGHCAPKLARSWPCSLCAEVMIGLW